MLILHLTISLAVAITPSLTQNKATPKVSTTATSTATRLVIPMTVTTPKTIDLRNFHQYSPMGKSKRKLEIESFDRPQGFIKKRETSPIDLRSSLISSDFLTNSNKDGSVFKKSFHPDNFRSKSEPSSNFDIPTFRGSSSVNINGPRIKNSASSSIDPPSFSSSGGTFGDDGGIFSLDGLTFDINSAGFESYPSFSVDNAAHDNNGQILRTTPTLESGVHAARASYRQEPIPSYSVDPSNTRSSLHNSDNNKPKASNIKTKSFISSNYDAAPKKNYSYHSAIKPSYTALQSSYPEFVYSSTLPELPYGNTKLQYFSDRSEATSKPNFKYASPSELSLASKSQSVTSHVPPVQNVIKNNLFDGQSTFSGGHPALQNSNPISFLQGGYIGPSQSSGSQATQNPVYTSQYPSLKNFHHAYAPAHQSAISFLPSTQSFEKIPQNLGYTSSGPFDYNKRTSSSPVVQLQNVQDIPGFIRTIESEPLVLTTGKNDHFRSAPNFRSSYNFGESSGNQPFLVPSSNHEQQQIIPFQSSSSTPQFPQYIGAVIKALPNNNYGNQPANYQPLSSQPQLHFQKDSQQDNNSRTLIVPKNLDAIREDVEIIKNKEDSAPPQSNNDEEKQDDSDEDDVDEAFEAIEQEYSSRSQEDGSSEPHVQNEQNSESGSLENTSEEIEFRNESSEENEDYPPTYSKQKLPYSNFASLRPATTVYDEDNEEGVGEQTYGKHDKDYSGSDHKLEEFKPLKSYEHKYLNKFDDYNKKPPQNKFTSYVEHSLNAGQPSSEDSTAYPKTPNYERVQDYTPNPTYHNIALAETSYENSGSTERSIKKRRKKPTKPPNRNSEEDGTASDYRNTAGVVYEDSFGYKFPQKEASSTNAKISGPRKTPTKNSYSRFTKDDDGFEKYSNVKKSPTEDSYVHSRRNSYKSKYPKKDNETSYKNGGSYSYSSGRNWKSNKKSPEVTDSHSYPSSDKRYVAYATQDNYDSSPERLRPGLSGSIFRDFINVY